MTRYAVIQFTTHDVRVTLWVVRVVMAALLVGCVEAGSIRIEAPVVLSESGDTAAVVIRGMPQSMLDSLRLRNERDPTWVSMMRVVVLDSTVATTSASSDTAQGNVPAVLGNYSVRGDRLVFVPRFGFAEGVTYRVQLRGQHVGPSDVAIENSPIITQDFSIARTPRAATTRITGVYPSGNELPENTLRWYVHFSAPMEPGQALEYFHLVDEAGANVPRAFLELDDELWDADRRRITILFDPGRIKRGLKANLESGAPLVAGRRYRLVIDANWKDARGAPLVSGYERQFAAVSADRKSPDPASWTLSSVHTNTRAALQVEFDGIADQVLANRIQVEDSRGNVIEGNGTLSEDGVSWTFTPSHPWRDGEYHLRIPPTFEDLAGNRIDRLFDQDIDTQTKPSVRSLIRSFRSVAR